MLVVGISSTPQVWVHGFVCAQDASCAEWGWADAHIEVLMVCLWTSGLRLCLLVLEFRNFGAYGRSG